MIVSIIGVKYLEEYKLELTFDTNEVKTVDLKDRIFNKYKGVLLVLKDIDFFKKVRVDEELGTVCWPNEIDLAPETLYELGIQC